MKRLIATVLAAVAVAAAAQQPTTADHNTETAWNAPYWTVWNPLFFSRNPLFFSHADKHCMVDGREYHVHYDYNRMCCMVPATLPPGEPHYDATVTVFRDGKQYGDPMPGTYVEHGCFEDVPTNWVALALAVKHTKDAATAWCNVQDTNAIPQVVVADFFPAVQTNESYELRFDHELKTNWVPLWQDGLVSHECGVVTSNYYANFAWKGKISRVDLESSKLTLLQPPQRTVTNQPQQNLGIFLTNIIFQ